MFHIDNGNNEKNKAGVEDIDKLDTKAQIFNAALRLFAANGYENVSIRTIAGEVGIKTASIYYHYKSKEEILEACYNFFLENRHISRLNKDQYEPIIRQGTKKEILGVIIYAFPESIRENMILSLTIIFSRIYSDTRANEIYLDEIDCSMKYLIELFNCGIQIGRFYDFNVEPVSLIILNSRLFGAQAVTIDPEQKSTWLRMANDVFGELLNLIPFRY